MNIQHQLEKHNIDPAYQEVCTTDPCGNRIIFSNRMDPFGSACSEKPNGIEKMALSPNPSLDINESFIKSSQRKHIGILTSGGDSSGMNAAVRAIARMALQRGCYPYAIYEGYNGLCQGGKMIKRLNWEDVRGFLSIVSI